MTTETLTTVGGKSDDLWLNRGLAIAVLLACGVGLTNNSVDPDLWGHVQYGLDVIRDGHLHHQATYTYTAVGNRWINHENIAELLFAAGMSILGPTAVLAFKFTVGMGLFAWFLKRAYDRGADHVSAGVVFLLGSLCLMHFWVIRPQLLSYILFALMLPILSYAFADWEERWHLPLLSRRFGLSTSPPQAAHISFQRLHALWLLVPLMLVWANSHGAFIAGGCILAAYLGCRSLEILFRQGRSGAMPVLYLGLILAAALLVTLINPYGWDLHIKLFHKLRVPRPEIIEWQPPEFFSVVWIQFWALIALWIAAVCGATKRSDFTHLVIVTLTIWQAVEHRRHIAFVALLSLAWLAPLVKSLLVRLRGRAEDFVTPLSPAKRQLAYSGLAIGCLLAVGMFVDQLRVLPVPRNKYAVDAFQFMTDRGLTNGKLVVQFEWAQYAIMAFGRKDEGEPGLAMQFDGRFRTCYPQEVLDRYWDFDMGPTPPGTRYRSPQSPPIDGSRVLEHRSPDLVLVGRHRPAAVAVLEERQGDWTLLYQDKLAQLWGRRSKYDDPASSSFLPPDRREITDMPREGLVPWPALPVLRPANGSPADPKTFTDSAASASRRSA